jgi:tetratricopeptide (TPR) repeat protein
MQLFFRTVCRWSQVVAIVGVAGMSLPARAQRGAGPPGVLAQIRTALGHGDVTSARRLAANAAGADHEFGLALVEIFAGQDEAARARLTPLATASPLGDAALELGLLDLRRGRRAEADRRLQALSAVRTFATPDDYLRLARAAIGVREFLLANDAFQRVADVARADIQTAWGDMFLVRHRNGDAAVSYGEAIAADPEWVRAHVGLARALMDENGDAAEASLESARKIAADHPDVLLLTAELALAQKDPVAARAALDRLQASSSGRIEEAAWRVAIAYDEGGEPAAEAAMAAVRAIDPTSALGYRRAASQAARNYQFDAAAAIMQKGVTLDPADPFAQFDLGLYLTRTGDEAGARVALERSWAIDNSSPVTKNLLDLLDKLDTFVVVESGPLTFKFHPDEAAVLEPYAIPLAQEAWNTFSARYGITPAGPILIEVFSIHDDFAVRTLGLPGLVGALGACFGRVVTMDSPRAQQPGVFSWQATLWHEMAHVFSLHASEFKVPRWLTEGISAYEEFARVPAWGRELTLEYARQLSVERTFGVKGLPDAFKRPESLALAYFEASLVVEHLVALNGDEGLRQLLRAYGDGATDAEAFARAFGQSVDQVETSFAAFVAGRYGTLAAAMKPPAGPLPTDDIAQLRARAEAAPDNYEVQSRFGAELLRAGQLEAARSVLRRAAELAPQASGDGSPRAMLAAMARQAGDLAGARRELLALLEYDHANVGAARRLLAISDDDPAARDFALRVIADVDPFDASAHGQLGRRLLESSEFQPALVEFEVALALGPPNLAEAHSDIADALLRLGRRDDAKQAALRALMEAPTFARAQDLLLQAIGR